MKYIGNRQNFTQGKDYKIFIGKDRLPYIYNDLLHKVGYCGDIKNEFNYY